MITALILLESKAGGGNRTHDPLFTRQTLYLLSYADGTKKLSVAAESAAPFSDLALGCQSIFSHFFAFF